MPITATLISPDASFRNGLAKSFNQARGFHCVGCYSSMADLLARYSSAPSDMILIDVDFAAPDWLASVARAKALSATVQVVILVAHENIEAIVQALAQGACAYALRQVPAAQLLLLLEEIQKGGSPMSGLVVRKLVNCLQQQASPWQNVENLSLREREILEFLARGYPYKQIAGHLAISINTVRTYVRRLYSKLQVPCRAHVVLKCQPLSLTGLHG